MTLDDTKLTPFEKAKQFEKEDKHELAIKYYEQALSEGIGDEALSYQGKARSLIGLGRLDEALENHPIELLPNSASSLKT